MGKQNLLLWTAEVSRGVLCGLLLVNLVVLGIVFQERIAVVLQEWPRGVIASFKAGRPTAHDSANTGADAHDGHDHDHDTPPRLPVSDQARKNLGLTAQFLTPLQPTTFYRTLNVPGVVVELPGRTRLKVTTPLTGTVLEVYVTAGQTVIPGTPLFRVRLTHEDLVQTQKMFLELLGERDVERREVQRMSTLTETGAVAKRLLLERQYALEKIEAQLQVQREALRLHGLSSGQIETVETTRGLLQELEIVAIAPQEHRHEELHLSDLPRPTGLQRPTGNTEKSLDSVTWPEVNGIGLRTNGFVLPVSLTAEEPSGPSESGPQKLTPPALAPRKLIQNEHPPELIVMNLQVTQGQAVLAGEMLCELADFSQLLIEGKAFEKDAAFIARAEQAGWKLSATFEASGGYEELRDLKLSHVDNVIDPRTHILPFYVLLPNRLMRDQVNDRGERYITWKYRVGQRMQLQVPREAYENQFVVPADAVARDGVESVVFRENGPFFEQVSVHVLHRDHRAVVLANDGSLFPGDVIALRGAHQLLLALKMQGAPEVDPHAGHNH